MTYLLLKFAHLLAAAFFVGGVFFEVMILSRSAAGLDEAPRRQLSRLLGQRARKIMPWVVLTLYVAGFGLLWRYRGALQTPFASSFGILLSLKVVLALSILAHFIAVLALMASGRMTPRRSRWIHRSVLLQMILILFLAKGMFLLGG